MSCNGIMEEDPLAAAPRPSLVLTEAGRLLEAKAAWGPRRGAGLRLGLAFAGHGLVPPGGYSDAAGAAVARRVGAAVGGRQVGQLGGGALAVQQGREVLPHPQV